MDEMQEMIDAGTVTSLREDDICAIEDADDLAIDLNEMLADAFACAEDGVLNEADEMAELGYLIHNGGKAFTKVATEKDGKVIPTVAVANREEALRCIREEMTKEPEFEFLARICFKNNYHVQDFMEKVVTAPNVTKAEAKAVAHFQDVFASDKNLRGNTFEIIMLPGNTYKECIKEIVHF